MCNSSQKTTMFTPKSLREMAVTAHSEYLELLKLHPPGTYHEGRNKARELADRAETCAKWMEQQGIAALAHVGPFSSFSPLAKGTHVRIRKGSIVHSTKGEPRTTVRDQVIKIHFVDLGYVDNYARAETDVVVRQPRVTWAGAGGYWRWTDLNNVELLV